MVIDDREVFNNQQCVVRDTGDFWKHWMSACHSTLSQYISFLILEYWHGQNNRRMGAITFPEVNGTSTTSWFEGVFVVEEL